MKLATMMCTVLCTLSLLTMGPVYATSPQKSTIITINGDDVSKPRDCVGELACLLREADIDFILQHGSDRVTVFGTDQVAAACEAGFKAGKVLTVSTLNDSHTCKR